MELLSDHLFEVVNKILKATLEENIFLSFILPLIG